MNVTTPGVVLAERVTFDWKQPEGGIIVMNLPMMHTRNASNVAEIKKLKRFIGLLYTDIPHHTTEVISQPLFPRYFLKH